MCAMFRLVRILVYVDFPFLSGPSSYQFRIQKYKLMTLMLYIVHSEKNTECLRFDTQLQF